MFYIYIEIIKPVHVLNCNI